MNCLIGKKLGMTQIFNEEGHQVPVTAIEVGPCQVVQRKTLKQDGVDAVQLGFEKQKEQRLTRAQIGHFKRHKAAPVKVIREFRIDAERQLESGDTLTVSEFDGISFVDVIAVTKGRGFQGVVKRYGMGGGRATHGSKTHRGVGSIGQCTSPSRVFKNKKMPGQTGARQITVQNLRLVEIRSDDNLLLIRGAVPGPVGGTVIVRRSIKKA